MKKSRILNFSVVFEPENKGGYSVFIPDLLGCVTQGKNFEEAKKNAKEAITLYLEELSARKVPLPEQSESPIVSSIEIDLAEVRG